MPTIQWELRRRPLAFALLLGALSLPTSHGALAAETATYQIIADDMCCAGCAKKIAGQLYTAPGVVNVKADVKSRTVTVTAKPSPKLTIEKLWNAAEKGKGKPSKLTTSSAVYVLARPETLTPADQSTDDGYTIVVADLQAHGTGDRLAQQLQSVRGVAAVSVDAPQNALLVELAAGAKLSPWALISAVEQAEEQPLVVSGPHGRLTIEHQAAAKLSSRDQAKGGVR